MLVTFCVLAHLIHSFRTFAASPGGCSDNGDETRDYGGIGKDNESD